MQNTQIQTVNSVATGVVNQDQSSNHSLIVNIHSDVLKRAKRQASLPIFFQTLDKFIITIIIIIFYFLKVTSKTHTDNLTMAIHILFLR